MKVERKQEEQFVPIVITIETEAEARCLWHRLNVNTGKPLTKYLEENDLHESVVFAGPMWSSLNRVYHPKEK